MNGPAFPDAPAQRPDAIKRRPYPPTGNHPPGRKRLPQRPAAFRSAPLTQYQKTNGRKPATMHALGVDDSPGATPGATKRRRKRMEPPQPDHKPKPLGGAQFGNVNAVKTGHRSKRFGCVLARLGKRFGQPYVDVLRLRKKVEALLRERYGGLTLRQVARVQTLCRLEQSCRALELSIRDDRKMGTEELRGARHSICSWSRERDNVLRELLGDSNGHPGSDPWQALQTPPVPAPDPEDHPAPESVSEGVSGNDTADAEGSPP